MGYVQAQNLGIKKTTDFKECGVFQSSSDTANHLEPYLYQLPLKYAIGPMIVHTEISQQCLKHQQNLYEYVYTYIYVYIRKYNI